MTFAALLTKELRMRLRRESTIWLLVIYLLLMSLPVILFISSSNAFNGDYLSPAQATQGIALAGTMGAQLSTLLAFVQLFLILLVTPAFTSTAINGEKARRTFDLLTCSQLSSFELIAGKLAAGLVTACLFIAASIPLFSLIFFYGGVGATQLLGAFLVFLVTAILAGAIGLFCSTFLKRTAASTALAYLLCGIWVLSPWILNSGLALSPASSDNWRPSLLFIGNPALVLASASSLGGAIPVLSAYPLNVAPWISYTVISIVASSILMLLSVWLVKPDPRGRLSRLLEKRPAIKKVMASVARKAG